MYTRLLTFRGANDIDAGVAYVRDKVLPILRGQTGYRGMTASADRAAGVLGFLSLWDTEADREASFGALASARDEAVAIVGGELQVENFEEVVVDIRKPIQVGAGLMVTRVSMDPSKVDENIAFFKSEIAPQIAAGPGFIGMRNMVNRQTGQSVVGTVWEDDTSRKTAFEAALERRPAGIARGVTFGETSNREILFADLP